MLIKKLRSRGLTGRRKKKDEGFTLVELLVVITILGILAAVVIAAVSGIGDKGEASAKKTDISILQTSQEARCASENGGQFEDPLILQREGFQSSQSGYSDVDIDKTHGPCDGTSFTVWQPDDTSYKDSNGNDVSAFIVGCGGHREEFTKPPTRAVILDPQMDQIIIALGLEDDVLLAGSVPTEAIPAQYREGRDAAYLAARAVTIATSGQYYTAPGFLAAATAPATSFDTILGTYRAQWSPAAVGGSDFSEADLDATFGATPIHTYNGFAAGGCESDIKADTTAEGIARTAMEGVFRDVRNVGIIFDVQEKAAALITDIRNKIAANLNKAGNTKHTVALISSAGSATHSRYVGNHAFSGLVSLAGGVNAYADEFQPFGRITAPAASVPWTNLIDKDPDMLVFLHTGYDPTTGKLDCNYDPPDVPGPPPVSAPYATAATNTNITGLRAWQAGNYVCGSYYQLLGASVFSTELIETMANKLAEID